MTDHLSTIQKTSYHTLIVTNTNKKIMKQGTVLTTYYKCNYLKNKERACPAYIISQCKDKK